MPSLLFISNSIVFILNVIFPTRPLLTSTNKASYILFAASLGITNPFYIIKYGRLIIGIVYQQASNV